MTQRLPTITSDQVRQFDRAAAEEFGVPGRVLMENAGRAVAECLIHRSATGPVLVLCGKGNNGGDGFVAARHLDGAGLECRLLVTTNSENFQGDAAANLDAVRRAGLPVSYLGDAVSENETANEFSTASRNVEWIIDGLLGIGVNGAPRPPLAQLIRLANAADAKRLAIDVPSGLNADSGVAADPTLRADVTCTFAAAKTGLIAADAQPFVGQLHVASLGAPRQLLQRFHIE